MKTKSIALTVAVCFLAALGFAQNPNMGTWKLNEGKSKLAAGMIRNTTVVYAAAGDSVKCTTEGTGMNGKPMHTEWTGKFDGKDYPLTGDPSADTRAYHKVNDHTLTLENKKGGKVTTNGKIVVSEDGKTRTLSAWGKNAEGKEVTSISVYDKQ